jgi:glucose-6-phosphate 1-dehydrogenase
LCSRDFGAAGDLTMRKLAPSLYNLVKANLLPKSFAVVDSRTTI